MRLLQFVGLAVCLVSLVACSKQPGGGTGVADSAVHEGVEADGSSAGMLGADAGSSADSKNQAAEPEIDYGDWLRLPEGLDRRFSEPYPTLVQSAMAGDMSGQMNLALLSQQIASTLANAGKLDEAYEFVLQSGRALRAGMPGGEEILPSAIIANIYFSEAGALARSGQLTEAVSALDDAVAHGFTELTIIEQEPAFASVRESEGYYQRMEAWRKAVKEQIIINVRQELEDFETYPFAFAGTDIHGTEQSLEALKGKVVIVDFWGTWCPPCRAEIPSFVQLQEAYGEQGFQMIGLNYEQKDTDDENLQGVLDFAKKFSINYPCLLSDEETRAQVPNFQGYPTTLFIDRTGKVRMQAVGLHEYAYLEGLVSVLLAESE
ncbi:MAG: TlpA disulfide reductase family protein [Aureliella sp.]